MSKARLAIVFLLGSLALGGCKQDIGERCEQNSDCSSGICGNGGPGMTMANARTCSPSLPTLVPFTDASFPSDGGAGDADAALDGAGSTDATEGGAETAPSEGGAETAPSEAGAETSPTDASGTEAGG
jgi:hypothetical protein